MTILLNNNELFDFRELKAPSELRKTGVNTPKPLVWAPVKSSTAKPSKNFRDLNRADPDFQAKLFPFLEGLYQYYFRVDIEGWENVPEHSALFVGNHNGLLTFEVLMLFHAWFKHFGTSRRAVGLAHGIALNNPLFKWLIPKLGAIPAAPEVAFEALSNDYSLLVFPGGEKEAFRKFSERKKIDFYQRKGFIRLALRAKKPIVPVVSIGAHETYVILDRGEEIAKKLGLYDSMRLHGVPITFRSIFFAWCVATGIFTFFPLLLAPAALLAVFIPLPAKMSFRILPPIDPTALWNPEFGDEENIQAIYDHVLETMRLVMDEEYAKRKLPIFG
jgi:1-acyl-sn-glycerol-3-phosphate acyltransferase